jgi:hypothetical protein
MNSHNNQKFRLTFRNCREANVSIKFVGSISVLWLSKGDYPGRSPINPALFVVDKVIWDGVSVSTSVSPANSHFTNCSRFINHPIIRRCVVSILTTSLNKRNGRLIDTETVWLSCKPNVHISLKNFYLFIFILYFEIFDSERINSDT